MATTSEILERFSVRRWQEIITAEREMELENLRRYLEKWEGR